VVLLVLTTLLFHDRATKIMEIGQDFFLFTTISLGLFLVGFAVLLTYIKTKTDQWLFLIVATLAFCWLGFTVGFSYLFNITVDYVEEAKDSSYCQSETSLRKYQAVYDQLENCKSG